MNDMIALTLRVMTNLKTKRWIGLTTSSPLCLAVDKNNSIERLSIWLSLPGKHSSNYK